MFRSILKISSIILFIIIALVAFLYWQSGIVSNLVKDTLNSELEGVARIEYSELKGNYIETIEINDLIVILPDSSIIKTNYLRLTYNLSSILFKPYLIQNILFDSLHVNLNIKPTESEKIESKKFTIEDIPTILDSLISIDSLLSTLPEIMVKNVEVISGTISIPHYQFHAEHLHFKSSYSFIHDHFNFVIDKFSGRWLEKDLFLKQFHAEFSGNRERITLNKFQIEANDSYIYAKSEINYDESAWIIFDIEELYVDYKDIRPFVKITGVDTGYLSASINVVGTPQKFSAQLFANGITDDYRLDSLTLDIDFKDNEITVRDGKIIINQSLLTFTGNGSRKSSRGKIKYKNFNIANLSPESVKTDISGNITFDIKDLNLNHITGNVELLLYDSVIDSIKIDTLKFALLAVDNNFDIIEPSILRFADSSLFFVKGSLDRSLQLNAELTTEHNNLKQLLSALNFESVDGLFDANLTLSGNINNPDLNGFLFLPFLSKDKIQLDTINLDLQLQKIFTSRKGDAHFSIAKGKIDDFELTEAIVNASIDSNCILFDTLRFANNENYISLAGRIEQQNDTFNLGLNLFKINYQNYWIENSDSLLINFYPHEFVIEQAVFRAPGAGVIECRGYWDNEQNDLQVSVYVENIQVDPFRQFVDSTVIFGGVVNGEIQINDLLTEPDIETELTGQYLSYNKFSMGSISMEVEYDNGNIYFKKFNLKNGETQFNASGDISLKFIKENGVQKIDFIEGTESTLSVEWKNVDINQYLQMLAGKKSVKGQSSGKLTFLGSLKKPKLNIVVFADSLQYEKYKFTHLNLISHYDDGYIVLDSLQSEINNTFVDVKGWQKTDIDFTDLNFNFEDEPFNLKIYSKDDRIEFLGNFLDQVEKLYGDYETEITIQGTPAKPYIHNGFFRIENGELILSRVKDPITDLTVEAIIEDSVMRIENFTGYSIKDKDILEEAWGFVTSFFRLFKGEIQPEGQLTGNGTINLSNILHPEINLNLNMYELFVDYFVENTELLISSDNLKIEGRDTLNLTGEIIIGKGKYTVDLDKMRKKIYLSSTKINKGRTVSWNLDIKIPENFVVASSALDLVNNFELEISGDLRAIQEPHSPEMGLTGHVDILSGNYMAFGQRFEIRQGSIDFSNPKRINPEIEIFAEKQTTEYTIELAVNGNIDRLQQDLQIRDANGTYFTNLSFYDKLKYLSGSSSSGSGSELVSTGEDVINTSVETAIERGAQSITGLDKVEIQDSQGLVDLQSMKLNNGLQDASISIGKYLTSNLYLEYRSRLGAGAIPAPKLSWEAGNQISLAYKINRNWSVESAYAQTLRGNTLINIWLGWKTSF